MSINEYQWPQFSVTAAQQYARKGKTEEWVHIYLKSSDWANIPFSEGLKLQKRWWHGPLEMELSQLLRAVGVEADREYPVSAKYWSERTSQMAESMTAPLTIRRSLWNTVRAN